MLHEAMLPEAVLPEAMRVGVAGWSYADWVGIVYPSRRQGTPHPLEHIARCVDLVEVNATFYRSVAPTVSARWVELARGAPRLRFTAKVPSALTHGTPTQERDPIGAFRASLAPLEEAGRLLAVLAQHAVSFRRSSRTEAQLTALRRQLEGLPVVLELRHRSWFTTSALAWLKRLDISLAAIDLPTARDHPPAEHPCLGPIAYLRLHGRNASAWFDRNAGRDQRYDYDYSREQLDGIAARFRGMAAESESQLLVTNNHFRGQAMANAIELQTLLGGRPPEVPASLVEAYPRLHAQVRTVGQLSLFGAPAASSAPSAGGGRSPPASHAKRSGSGRAASGRSA